MTVEARSCWARAPARRGRRERGVVSVGVIAGARLGRGDDRPVSVIAAWFSVSGLRNGRGNDRRLGHALHRNRRRAGVAGCDIARVCDRRHHFDVMALVALLDHIVHVSSAGDVLPGPPRPVVLNPLITDARAAIDGRGVGGQCTAFLRIAFDQHVGRGDRHRDGLHV